MIKLFRGKRIEDYLNTIYKNIINEIDKYSVSTLTSLEIDETVAQLLKKNSITPPVLEKSNTTNSIKTVEVSGHQLPSGTRFVMGQLYAVDVARYSIPFSGDKNIFECTPTSFTGWTCDAEINYKSIVIELTNWGKITGDDNAIETIKNELVQVVNHIENGLTSASADIDKFNLTLATKIKSHLSEKVNLAKIKINSTDKLNPFK